MHRDFLLALGVPRGLVLMCAPTGHGKTTIIDQVLADPAVPLGVAFLGDIRDAGAAVRAVELAREKPVVAVLRVPRAAGAFGRFVDMGVRARDLASVTRAAFSVRLLARERLLLHELLVVSDAIRDLIVADADEVAVHRCAVAEGMVSLRCTALKHVRAGRLALATALGVTPDD